MLILQTIVRATVFGFSQDVSRISKIHATYDSSLLLPVVPLDVVETSGVRSLDRVEHDVHVDVSIEVPDGLPVRTRELRDLHDLVVRHLRYAEQTEGDREVDGQHEPNVLVELILRHSVQNELRDDAERDCRDGMA